MIMIMIIRMLNKNEINRILIVKQMKFLGAYNQLYN